MLDEVFRQRFGVGDELVGDHIGLFPAPLVEGVFGSGGAHGRIPHRQGELLVTQRPGTVERIGGAERQADQAGRLRFAAGGAAKVEIARRKDQVRTLVDQLHRGVAHGDRIRLAVDVDELDLLPKEPARIIDRLDGDLRAPVAGRVERRLVTGQAESSAKGDLPVLRTGRPGERKGGDRRANDRKPDYAHSCIPPLLLFAHSPRHRIEPSRQHVPKINPMAVLAKLASRADQTVTLFRLDRYASISER